MINDRFYTTGDSAQNRYRQLFLTANFTSLSLSYWHAKLADFKLLAERLLSKAGESDRTKIQFCQFCVTVTILHGI